jgi:hypothetical protein
VALDSDNVRVAVTGLVSVAPTGTAAPTSSASALNVAFVDLGYLDDSGVVETRERTVTDITAWQESTVVRTIVTDGKYVLKFTMIETTVDSQETFYGSEVLSQSATDGRIDIVPTSTGGRKSWVVDVVDGAEAIRIYVPSGEVTEVGDVSYVSTGTISYPVTVTGYPVAGVSASRWSTALKTP